MYFYTIKPDFSFETILLPVSSALMSTVEIAILRVHPAHTHNPVYLCKWISLVEVSPYILFHTQIRSITKERFFISNSHNRWHEKLVPWQISTQAALWFVTINKTYVKPNILKFVSCWQKELKHSLQNTR